MVASTSAGNAKLKNRNAVQEKKARQVAVETSQRQ